tara:strand:- start:1914 stop:2456 length:543 start_codon:yes stop_codon:yes gene_type:complete
MKLEKKIEGILFYKAEPVSYEYLCKTFSVSSDDLNNALTMLSEQLNERGIVLVKDAKKVALGTNPELASMLEKIAKEEVSGPLTKAALETLAIIVYRGPVTKSNIDYIRGVNSQFILRNLVMRGLISRSQNPQDARTFLYTSTLDLLSFLGVTEIPSMPGYNEYREKITAFEEKQSDEEI